MFNDYLRNVEDGLDTRPSGEYALEKLDIVNRCINMFSTAMKNQAWISSLNYVDLLAGPGKNKIRETGEIRLGSPLLALTATDPFDNYYFVEADAAYHSDLITRAKSSKDFAKVKSFPYDCNRAVDDIVHNISQLDKSNPAKSSLNIVFVDSEGLEVNWKTVEKLGRRTRSDLIINFSTSGITRNIREAFNSEKDHAIDNFLGTRDWRVPYSELSNRGDGTVVRRFVLDLYAKQLGALGYQITAPNGEYVVLNSTNRQLYSLFCASKSDLGIKFFNTAADKFRSPKLPGFDV